ncbi:SOS response-associated peptidase family protein [Pseudomonas citronellolis]|uniref:SOS response-associated peptidase family protein n=1 Tax=Pseudomonas citronellolis TaxID=53408 RepID=UPI00248F44D1|nr:SOS response-associated peptidase family protein [Pseudomonas citronellolis]
MRPVLFIPAVGQFPHPGGEPHDTDGFRMITDNAAGGMRNVHDRRPVVLSATQAYEWLDLQTGSERAEQLLHQGLPAVEFYRVSKAVSHREEGAALITSYTHNDLNQ